MNIADRIRKLEAQTLEAAPEPLTEQQRRQMENWPEKLLEHYCEGRLDELAGMPSIPILKLLQGLERDGYAIEVDGHWHPLFLGNDDEVNEQFVTRINACDQERISAAIDAQRRPA